MWAQYGNLQLSVHVSDVTAQYSRLRHSALVHHFKTVDFAVNSDAFIFTLMEDSQSDNYWS